VQIPTDVDQMSFFALQLIG